MNSPQRSNKSLGYVFLLVGLALAAFILMPQKFGIHDDSGLTIVLFLIFIFPTVLTLIALGLWQITKSDSKSSESAPKAIVIVVALVLLLTPFWMKYTPWQDGGWLLAAVGICSGLPLLIAGIRQKD
jgi:peptidoglycan/LPS O-acetylase OafA/YrhL